VAALGLLKFWREGLIALLLALCGVQTVRLSWAHEEIATEAAAREKAIREAQARADALSDELIIAQAQAMAVTEKKVVTYVDRIRTVQAPDTACAADERSRLGSRGVRDIVRGGGPQAVGGSPAAVQGPGASARP
jgi:hypothetical protein